MHKMKVDRLQYERPVNCLGLLELTRSSTITNMKRVIGSILCILAILLMFGEIFPHKADTAAHKIQDWAVISVLLAIGIPLSGGKKKPEDR